MTFLYSFFVFLGMTCLKRTIFFFFKGDKKKLFAFLFFRGSFCLLDSVVFFSFPFRLLWLKFLWFIGLFFSLKNVIEIFLHDSVGYCNFRVIFYVLSTNLRRLFYFCLLLSSVKFFCNFMLDNGYPFPLFVLFAFRFSILKNTSSFFEDFSSFFLFFSNHFRIKFSSLPSSSSLLQHLIHSF